MPTATLPQEAFRLSEAISVKAGTANDDGTVNLHIIRPGIGRGKGKHLYTPEMLAENAQIFEGWRMYVDHLSEEARRRLGGLPRSIRDLGGRIVEAHWDPSIPADPENGWGQGAVVGRAKPVPLVRELIEHDPGLIEASISARATNIKSMQHQGQQVWMVEGIEPNGSVDWVTEAGAGGRVVSLMESHMDEEGIALLETLTDEDLLEHIERERPDLLPLVEAKVKAKNDGKPDGGEAAQEGTGDEEEDDVPLTTEALREVLESDEGKALVDELVNERVAVKVAEVLPGKIDEALEEERELSRIEHQADADRRILVRDMKDRAQTMISEAKLPDEFKAPLLAKYSLVDNRPTPSLDVIEETDDQGAVTKTAMQVLEESVTADLEESRRLLAAARPTRVTHARSKEGSDDENLTDEQKEARRVQEARTTGSPLTDKLLRGAGFEEDTLEKVYG